MFSNEERGFKAVSEQAVLRLAIDFCNNISDSS